MVQVQPVQPCLIVTVEYSRTLPVQPLALLETSRSCRADLTLRRIENTITYRDESDHHIFEQSTSNIWSCLAKCCKSVLQQSGVSPEAVKGVSFDATCSLTAVDGDGTPISVTKGQGLGKPGDRNVILWADHRAEKEAEEINQTGEGVLNFVGGVMSVSSLLYLRAS